MKEGNREIGLPPVIDLELCKNLPGYEILCDDEIIQHFYRLGEMQGELVSPLCEVDGFVDWLNKNFQEKDILEIGPGSKPRMKGKNVKYYDRFTTENLKAQIKRQKGNPEGVPHIDYTGMGNNLQNIEQKFDLVFSCHNLEHIPDPVSHLNGIAGILKPDGLAAFILPNKLYTFDHFRKPSVAAEIVEAYLRKADDRPPFSAWFEGINNLTHNNSERHWQGYHGEQYPHISIREAYDKYLKEVEFSEFHRWIFEPRNFYSIFNELAQSGLVHLTPARIYSTPVNGNSFNVIMRPARLLRGFMNEPGHDAENAHAEYLRKIFDDMARENVKLQNELASHPGNKYQYLVMYRWNQGEIDPELETALKNEITGMHARPHAENAISGFTELIYAIWLLRKDLHKYNPATPQGQTMLVKWFHDWGIKELKLEFLER